MDMWGSGIAHTKLLAKLGSGLHKPASQTLVPACAVESLLADLPISKLRQLGGKFGNAVQQNLGISTVGGCLCLALHICRLPLSSERVRKDHSFHALWGGTAPLIVLLSYYIDFCGATKHDAWWGNCIDEGFCCDVRWPKSGFQLWHTQ